MLWYCNQQWTGLKGSDGINTTGSDLEVAACQRVLSNGMAAQALMQIKQAIVRSRRITERAAMTGLSWLEQPF